MKYSIPWIRFKIRLTTEYYKPAVMSRVSCRRSTSRRKGPFVTFAHRRSFASSPRAFFLLAVFRAAPLTERLEEATLETVSLYIDSLWRNKWKEINYKIASRLNIVVKFFLDHISPDVTEPTINSTHS